MKLMDRIKGVALGIAFLHAGEDMNDPAVNHERFPTDNARVDAALPTLKAQGFNGPSRS